MGLPQLLFAREGRRDHAVAPVVVADRNGVCVVCHHHVRAEVRNVSLVLAFVYNCDHIVADERFHFIKYCVLVHAGDANLFNVNQDSALGPAGKFGVDGRRRNYFGGGAEQILHDLKKIRFTVSFDAVHQ